MSVPDVLPPSPPTTNHRDRISMPLAFKPVMSTPDDSPASFPPSSSTGLRKRVEFSPWPNVVDPISSTPAHDMTALKALPPSRDCQRNGRSILKPYVEPAVAMSSFDGSVDSNLATPETLEAIAQQLSTNNKGSSLDAYQTLSLVIKLYDEVPEDVNTKSCIATILRCIKRDLSMQDQIQSSPIDTNLMTQALKVSVILVWSEHLSPLLTDEFRVFIIDRSINALAEHTAPKVIIIHYMHLLAMQSFRQGILSSNNRAIKLLEALQDITNHVQGKGAMSERLLIYQKLIEQAKSVMKARAALWVKEIFLGLASSVKDIRDKAISVSTRACAAFPASPTVSAAAKEALAGIITDRAGNSRTISAILTQRLEKMVAAKDEANQVPQIWAVCMLLCNSIETRLESWGLLRDWLKVIQRCFNCSDTSVRSQAFPAWNRFIHISKPHEASDSIVSMLAKPIIAQIERTSTNTTGKGLRPAAVSSYCMLLYHAFRPAATHKQYTRMWNEYIVKIMGTQFLAKSTANADLSSRIIMSMMWKDPSTSRVWNENRAHENTLLEPEELPTIDCKWVRSKTEAILQIFGLLFKHSVWGPSVQHSDQAYVAKAWRHFLKAIRESASKEVKPSADTRKALFHIMHYLRETSELETSYSHIDRIEARSQLACSIAVTELGPLCFIESMEADISLRPTNLLAELLKYSLHKSEIPLQNQRDIKSHAMAIDFSPAFNRTLKLLDQVLQSEYIDSDSRSPTLRLIMSTTSRILKLVPPEMLFTFLGSIQSGLAMIMYDDRGIAKQGLETSIFPRHWMDLSITLVDCILALPLSMYEQLDVLLAAMLTSHNTVTQNLLLKAWAAGRWHEDQASYGPRLLAAIGIIQAHAEVNLPGICIASVEPDTQVLVEVHVNTPNDIAHSPISAEPIDINMVPEAGNNSHHTSNDIILDNTRAAQDPLPMEQNEQRARVHHNDSQIHFIPVNSSPGIIDEMESQYLTEHQKEVRDRQHEQQLVTFPDLRSSPRSRSKRGSQAPSVDCEIARKAAALESLPSTPTINRQNDGIDEDELPSPTPKARHKVLDLRDVDIPSSPPSAVGSRKKNCDAQDVPSSPPKPQNEGEIDIVNLADANLANDEQNSEVEKLAEQTMDGELPNTSVVCESVETHVVVDNNIKQPSQLPMSNSDKGSTVLETVQEANVRYSEQNSTIGQRSPTSELDQNVGSDEIDELSASQLSQSLSWHIAEEAKQASAAVEAQTATPEPQKRRKRTTSGYADQDGKKRRRRTTSRNDTSMSSLASEESFVTGEDFNAVDCIVVSTSPPVTPSRHLVSSRNGTQDTVGLPTASSTGKLRRTTRHKSSRIPLHLRSPNSEGRQDDRAGSQFTEKELERGSTEPLSQSLYENIVNISANIDTIPEKERIESNLVPPLHRVETSREEDNITGEPASLARDINIMTALQTVLDGLKHVNKDQQANIDLKAIDDLCFKIRYQAQEIVQGRLHG